MADVKEEVKVEEFAKKKREAFEKHTKEVGISGFQYDGDENLQFARSNYIVEGQQLPLYVTFNNTIYNHILVVVAPKIKEENFDSVLKLVNALNSNIVPLKYYIDGAGSLVLTCSLPVAETSFDPQLIVALIEQVQLHLNEVYPEIMKEVWASKGEEVVEAKKEKKGKK